MRKSGILLHISSLPSRFGIGRMGKAAYDFVDFLHASETACWQILPLSPTSYGDSPYQSFSVYAGNPYFIDFVKLEEQGLLEREDYASVLWQRSGDAIDYELLYRSNIVVLKRAFTRSIGRTIPGYQEFKEENKSWLHDYALFMALKDEYNGAPWYAWDKPLAMREPGALAEASARLTTEIEMHSFIQFLFARQWSELKAYANEKHIEIIGDMPIYVAYDSADVWCSPELFALDAEKRPVEVAGCPPDPFSPTGQLWGNPLYDWDYHRKTGYAWWISRLKHAASLYDIIRIDHFRGFESYYTIPYGSKDATVGKWRKGPNKQLFQTVNKALGSLNIIAEDLGFITPEVRKMLDALGYPGMKVLQFGFDSDPANEHLPHNFKTSRCVAYTGTHDNETLRGWLSAADKKTVKYAKNYLRCKKSQIPDEMVAACWGSIADLAVAQMQDFLRSDKDCRMNTPSVLGGNWMFRTDTSDFTPELAKEIRKLNRTYGRAVQETPAEAVETVETAETAPAAMEEAPAEEAPKAPAKKPAPRRKPNRRPRRNNAARKPAAAAKEQPVTEQPAEKPEPVPEEKPAPAPEPAPAPVQEPAPEPPAAEAPAETPAPKRRGRPRKDAAKPAESKPAPKKPGRPKKSAAKPAQDAAPAEEKPKRRYTKRKKTETTEES